MPRWLCRRRMHGVRPPQQAATAAHVYLERLSLNGAFLPFDPRSPRPGLDALQAVGKRAADRAGADGERAWRLASDTATLRVQGLVQVRRVLGA